VPVPLERLPRYEAIELFRQRAVALSPDFALNEDNAPAVVEICRRLDGLPLAIELAAARVRHLSPQAILDRLHSRLEVLTGGARDLPSRHQTLRATIEWSYALLTEPEKQLFNRLAVFRGGCTLEAVEVVCLPESDALDLVASLIDKNLLKHEEGSKQAQRYVMLETIHEYAREMLEGIEESKAIHRGHALYFTELVEHTEPLLRGVQQVDWLDRLELEHDNCRAALDW
jgi:predicted ATPase